MSRSISAPISVVIPAHNEEAFIADAIESANAQSLKPTEIVVVADACSDRTAEIAANLGARVFTVDRRNMAAALNVAVNASTQPWIAFLDADDYWAPDKIGSQMDAIEACPAAAMVSCDVLTLVDKEVTARTEDYVRGRWENVEYTQVSRDCHYISKVTGDFLTRFFLATPTVMVRREVFPQVGSFDESLLFGQTLEFFARVLARYPLLFVERALVYHRIHDKSHTTDFAGYWTTYLALVDRILKSPHLYPPGAGDAYRRQLKEQFHQSEKFLARK